jgi:hypothetical protein
MITSVILSFQRSSSAFLFKVMQNIYLHDRTVFILSYCLQQDNGLHYTQHRFMIIVHYWYMKEPDAGISQINFHHLFNARNIKYVFLELSGYYMLHMIQLEKSLHLPYRIYRVIRKSLRDLNFNLYTNPGGTEFPVFRKCVS